jgi:hypothetical protein
MGAVPERQRGLTERGANEPRPGQDRRLYNRGETGFAPGEQRGPSERSAPGALPEQQRGLRERAAARTGKSLFARDCVVGLGGLEPPTKRLSAASSEH